MVMCYILNCKSNTRINDGTRFFSFPKDETMCKKWLSYCRPNTEKKRDARVCSKHFVLSDYRVVMQHIVMNQSSKTVRLLKPEAVPSLELSFDVEKGKVHTGTKHTNTKISHEKPTENGAQVQKLPKIKIKTDKKEVDISKYAITIPIEEYDELNARVKNLEKELKEKTDMEQKYNQIIARLNKIFSPGQVHSLITDKKVTWSDKDIKSAASLRNISPKAYNYLKGIGIPLPDCSTIQRRMTAQKLEDRSKGSLEDQIRDSLTEEEHILVYVTDDSMDDT